MKKTFCFAKADQQVNRTFTIDTSTPHNSRPTISLFACRQIIKLALGKKKTSLKGIVPHPRGAIGQHKRNARTTLHTRRDVQQWRQWSSSNRLRNYYVKLSTCVWCPWERKRKNIFKAVLYGLPKPIFTAYNTNKLISLSLGDCEYMHSIAHLRMLYMLSMIALVYSFNDLLFGHIDDLFVTYEKSSSIAIKQLEWISLYIFSQYSFYVLINFSNREIR